MQSVQTPELQGPIDSLPTDPEELDAVFTEFEKKYFDLVWYASSQPREVMEEQGPPEHIIQGALNGQARKEEMYPEDIDAFKENPDWTHGFNSGCLAAMRFVLTAMSTEVFPNEESENPTATWTMGGCTKTHHERHSKKTKTDEPWNP